MPANDREVARTLQQKYFGNPQGLARHLVSICLNQIGVVREVFLLLDNFSTLDVSFRFLNLLPTATLLSLAKTKNGKAFCQILLSWLLNTSNDTSQAVSPGIDLVIELRRLKDAIDNASPPEDGKNPYYTIDAGIVLSDEAIKFLDKIGVEYYKRTGKRFNVNSGTRTPYRQANAMLGVIEAGDKTLSKYGNRQAINEILNAYRTGKSRDEKVQAMADVIQSQVNRNIFISNHLKAGGIDIATVGDTATGVPRMSAAEEKIMIEIAKKVTGGQAFKEMFPEHIHIQYK